MIFGAARTGQDVDRAAWAQLGFEASQVTNRPLQSVGLRLGGKDSCFGLWKPQPSNEKSNYGKQL